MGESICREVREQTRCPFSSSTMWGSLWPNSGCQAWQQVPLPTGPSCRSGILICLGIYKVWSISGILLIAFSPLWTILTRNFLVWCNLTSLFLALLSVLLVLYAKKNHFSEISVVKICPILCLVFMLWVGICKRCKITVKLLVLSVVLVRVSMAVIEYHDQPGHLWIASLGILMEDHVTIYASYFSVLFSSSILYVFLYANTTHFCSL